MGISTADQRISSFCVGLGLAAFFGFLGWLFFFLETMKMNPAADYWATVLERAQSNLTLTAMFGMCCVVVLVGFVMMVRAVFGGSKQSHERSAAE